MSSMSTKDLYQPPYSLTPAILNLVAEISERIGHYTASAGHKMTPHLRRENRIRTIQASLAIENNTLSLSQVTAIIDGKRVLGHPREIQEVVNAFDAYEAMKNWNPASGDDLLTAHALLMKGLVADTGAFRSGGVGIYRRGQLMHMAPPANRIPLLMGDLLDWLNQTDTHPLVAGCVFHYELEFIHPFSDGNGRMGRLWQTLILSRWKPLFAYLPVETLIRDAQDDYYQVLGKADEQGEATLFIEFMLKVLLHAIQEMKLTDQASDYVTDQVLRLAKALMMGALGTTELMSVLGLSHRPTFRKNYLNPALETGWIERTQPDSPRSPTQRYRLTEKGRLRLHQHKDKRR
jgi:Fic family protein